MKRILLILSCVILSPLASCASRMQTQEIKELKDQVAELQRNFVDQNLRLAHIESRTEIIGQKTAELDARIQTISEQKQPAMDVLKLTPGDAPAPTPAPDDPTKPKRVITNEMLSRLDPIALYNETFLKLQKGRLNDAERGFKEFIELFPSHENADNAYYWLGEIQYSKANYAQALDMFTQILDTYPKGNKVPDAMVKIGYCHLKLGRVDEARKSFKRVMDEHPFSFAANQAQSKLEEIQ